MLLWLALACTPVDSDTETVVETDTDTDTDVDTDTDTDTDVDWPCGDVAGVVELGGAPVSSVLDSSDPERWTGSGDLPTELLAVELSDTSQVFLKVEYPEPNLGTSQSYWMRIHWLDAACDMHFGTGFNGGAADTDHVTSQFTPDQPGWWFPMLFFPEAMVQPGSIAYTATLHPEMPN